MAKVVVFGQKLLYLFKSCCIRAKWLFSGKTGFIRAKVVVFRNVIVIRQK